MLQMHTTFKNTESTEFYLFDHLNGVLTMLVDDGCMKGIYTRCDSKCAGIYRKYHREQVEGVPFEHRLYDTIDASEFHSRYIKVVDALNRSFDICFTETTEN
jgi:hypothetical protein